MLTFAVLPNAEKENAAAALQRIVRFLDGRGARIVMPEAAAHHFGCAEYAAANIEEQPIDFALSVGGDGTLLGVVRRFCRLGVPVCGVNIGNVGFLADIELAEIEEKLAKIIAGECRIEERVMVAGFVYGADGAERQLGIAINDAAIVPRFRPRMVSLALAVDGHNALAFKGDGLIVSTATGSTAYSLAAGGPLVHPSLNVLVITPICPHTFNARPLVIDGGSEVVIDIRQPHSDINITFDGQTTAAIGQGEKIIVRRTARPAKIVKFADKNYYQTIKTKLPENA